MIAIKESTLPRVEASRRVATQVPSYHFNSRIKCFQENSSDDVCRPANIRDRPTNAQYVEHGPSGSGKLGERTTGIKPFFRYVTSWVEDGTRESSSSRDARYISSGTSSRYYRVIRYILKRKLLLSLRPDTRRAPAEKTDRPNKFM